MHQKCPVGEKSQCFYNTAKARNQSPVSHSVAVKSPLSEKLEAKTISLYKRLASDSLPSRCISVKTQYANEALHYSIWSKMSKKYLNFKNKIEVGYW